MKNSAINWTDNTFNPWQGCTKLGSPGSGCDNCYAAADDGRHLHGDASHWGKGVPRRIMSDAYWAQPLAWDRQAARSGIRPRVFCASTADWADDEAPAGQRERLFELIRNTPNLDWLLLTKRATSIKDYLPGDWGEKGYPNVWLGVTVENKKHGKPRIAALLKSHAVCHFLSCEPLLEDLGKIGLKGIDWVIIGGETGRNPSKKACEGTEAVAVIRSMDVRWAASLIEHCHNQEPPVAVWFKQLGKLPLDLVTGKVLEVFNAEGKRSPNGANWDEWPENLAHLRIREIPDFRSTELSKVDASLSDLAKELNEEQADKEKKLRSELLGADQKLFQTRQDRAKIIQEYHGLYNPLRKWADFCRAVAMPKRTAYDLLRVAREEESNRAKSARFDQKTKPKLTPQEAAVRAKSSVNRLLKGLTGETRREALKLILAVLQAEDLMADTAETIPADEELKMLCA